ncbi:MAG TPA: hypothetical protein VFU22_14270 [Roseiflexaceae bacterium]|nr:hypothetical protein [Roseiflexaceae bacterium]
MIEQAGATMPLVQVYDGTLVSLAAWHDYELGFANRLAEVSQRLAG